MELEEEDLRQSKGTKPQKDLHLYEALLTDVRFRIVARSQHEAEWEMAGWLSEHTAAYKMQKVYMVNENAWAPE